MKTNKTLSRCLPIILLVALAALIAGCGSRGGGSSSSSSGSATVNGTISGTAVKGPVAGSTVTAFSINSNGTKGESMGVGQTDSQGGFSVSVGDHSGPVLLEMRGGTYMDEATGNNMTMHQNDSMTAVMPSMTSSSAVSGIHMTPMTSMAQSMAQNMPGGMTGENITLANDAICRYFNVNDILHTAPMNTAVDGSGLSASQDMRNYGMAIAAMSKYAGNMRMSTSSGIVTAMMNDASDGRMNGMMGGSSIMMGGGMMGGSMMPADAGTSGMADAMTQFIQSPMNKSGVTLKDMSTMINMLGTSDGVIQ